MKRGQKIDDGFHSYLIDYPGINSSSPPRCHPDNSHVSTILRNSYADLYLLRQVLHSDYLRFSSYAKNQAPRNSFLPNLQTETGIVSISHFSNTTKH